IRKAQVGWTPVNWIARRAPDSELRGHVRFVREEGKRLVAAAAEIPPQVIHRAPAERVRPAEPEAHPAARRLVAISEDLLRDAIGALDLEIAVEAIFPSQCAVQDESELIAIRRDGVQDL